MTHALIDLDGVVYRGTSAIPGSAASIRRLEDHGIRPLFVTNNSTRTQASVVAKLKKVAGVEAAPERVVTSAMAAVAMLDDTESTVLVIGEEGVRTAVIDSGRQVSSGPKSADAVLVGLTKSFDYDRLRDAFVAISSGARFIATNRDPTYPSENGLLPGSGAIVAAIEAATERVAEVAGKPSANMVDLIRGHDVGVAWVIGDRLDTDIALAENQNDWKSILVLSGVSNVESAGVEEADFVRDDLVAAVDLVIASEER